MWRYASENREKFDRIDVEKFSGFQERDQDQNQNQNQDQNQDLDQNRDQNQDRYDRALTYLGELLWTLDPLARLSEIVPAHSLHLRAARLVQKKTAGAEETK